MALTDDELLDFDKSEIADCDPGTTERLLVEQPELYRNPSTIARTLREWPPRMMVAGFGETDYGKGFLRAVHDIAAPLRCGDLLPGGDSLSES